MDGKFPTQAIEPGSDGSFPTKWSKKCLDHSRPFLIVGLGQAGLEALVEVQATLEGAPNCLKWLFLDFDPSGWERLGKKQQAAFERNGLTAWIGKLPDPGSPDTHALFENEYDAEWLSLAGDEWKEIDPTRSRICARMSFFLNFNGIRDRLKKGVETLANADSAAIYVVGALGDPTGGLIIDLVFSLRHLLKEKKTSIEGVFLLDAPTPDLPDARAADTYASLLELNHYQKPINQFRSQYTQHPESKIRGNGPTFDCLSLFAETNGGGQSLSGAAQLARWILLDQACGDRGSSRPRLRSIGLGQVPYPGEPPVPVDALPTGGQLLEPIQGLLAAAQPHVKFEIAPAADPHLRREWRLFLAKGTSGAELYHDQICSAASAYPSPHNTGTPAGAAGRASVGWVDFQSPDQCILVCEEYGFPLERLAWLDEYQRAYQKQKTSGHYRYRLDEEKFGVLQPVVTQLEAVPNVEIPSLSQVTIHGHTLKLVSEPIEQLSVEARVCPRARSLGKMTGAEGEIWEALRAVGKGDLLKSAEEASTGRLDELRLCDYFVSAGAHLPRPGEQSWIVHLITVDDAGYTTLDPDQLRLAIEGILEECNEKNWHSIALPQMASQLPASQYVDLVYQAITDHFSRGREYPKTVVLSLQSPDAIVHFVEKGIHDERDENYPLDQAILNKFPYSIAKAYRNYLNAKEWGARIEEVTVALFEATLQFITFLTLAERLSLPDQQNQPDQSLVQLLLRKEDRKDIQSIHGRFLGPWMNGELFAILLQNAKKLSEQPGNLLIPELAEMIHIANSIQTNALVTERNNIVHNHSKVIFLDQGVTNILKSLRWLSDYAFLSCYQSNPLDDGNYAIEFRVLQGIDDLFHRLILVSDVALSPQIKGPVMIDLNKKRWLYLYPFYVTTQDDDSASKPGAVNLHTLNSVNRNENKEICCIYPRAEGLAYKSTLAYRHFMDLLEKRPAEFISRGEARHLVKFVQG